jgi:hypothetical protein
MGEPVMTCPVISAFNFMFFGWTCRNVQAVVTPAIFSRCVRFVAVWKVDNWRYELWP